MRCYHSRANSRLPISYALRFSGGIPGWIAECGSVRERLETLARGSGPAVRSMPGHRNKAFINAMNGHPAVQNAPLTFPILERSKLTRLPAICSRQLSWQNVIVVAHEKP